MAAERICVAGAAAEHDDIAVHMPLSGHDPSLEQLADMAIPSNAEAQSLAGWHRSIASCREAKLAAAETSVPAVAIALRSEGNRLDDVYLKLLQRRISWSTANHQIMSIRLQSKREVATAISEINDQLREEDRTERARRDAALAAIGQSAASITQAQQQSRMLDALTKPVNTTCMHTGSITNCSTY